MCPACGDTRLSVIDTRSYSTVFVRQRQCRVCGTIFETQETLSGLIRTFRDDRKKAGISPNKKQLSFPGIKRESCEVENAKEKES